MKWRRCAIIRRSCDACRAVFDRLERLAGAIAPRATKVLSVFVMIAALKLGILLFLGLDLMLPDPPVRQAILPLQTVTALTVPGPSSALAQQPPAPAGKAPDKPAPAPVATTPDAQALLKRQEELDLREQALKTLETDHSRARRSRCVAIGARAARWRVRDQVPG